MDLKKNFPKNKCSKCKIGNNEVNNFFKAINYCTPCLESKSIKTPGPQSRFHLIAWAPRAYIESSLLSDTFQVGLKTAYQWGKLIRPSSAERKCLYERADDFIYASRAQKTNRQKFVDIYCLWPISLNPSTRLYNATNFWRFVTCALLTFTISL